MAGPVPEWGPGDPLALSRGMRARLFTAVRSLLADASLQGAPDAVRLAAVVLLAKAPARSVVMQLRAGELARWLGFSESYVDHTVLPALREAKVVTTKPVQDEIGQVTGLEWKLLPLLAAREGGDVMHPLALDKKQLATLLRLCEAVFGPGWAPTDGPLTPAGLLASRRGRGAATDRLALLLLILQSRPDGRVRLVGGSVKEGRGRADATTAKALGCSVSGGAKVVDRLALGQFVEVVRGTTEGGQLGKGRLVVPAVAAAHRRVQGRAPESGAAEVAGPVGGSVACASCAQGGVHDQEETPDEGLVLSGEGWQQESFDDVEPPFFQRPADAPGDLDEVQDDASPENTGESAADGAGEAGVVERPAGAPLHATHAPVVDVSGSLTLGSGLSGEADRWCGSRPERAGVREGQADHSVDERDEGAAEAAVGQGGPLRGEQHNEVPGEQQEVAGGSAARRSAGRVVFTRPARLPEGLESVLAPVAGVWARLGRAGARRRVLAGVRVQLGVLGGVVGPEAAEEALAERLGRRLDQEMGRPVNDPVGWILRRGLPQRALCWSQMCDEGRRMDSGADCPSCQVLIGDRRGLRARIAQETAQELAGAAPQVLRAEIERRLQSAVAYEAAVQAVRRERAVVEQAERRKATEQRRAELAAAERARLDAPCADCGLPEAASLCLLCSERRHTERALAEAVDFAVLARADLADPADVARITESCARDTAALVDGAVERLRAQGVNEAGLVLEARERAQQLREGRRSSLHARLMRSERAEVEADNAYQATIRAAHRYLNRATAVEAAEKAADQAQERAAGFLLAERTRQLELARGQSPARPPVTDWPSRCAELAAQPLPGDRSAAFAAPVCEAVSAA